MKKIYAFTIGIICFAVVSFWFSKGLLFAGGEESLFFFNLQKHQTVISSLWYPESTGSATIAFLARYPYFTFLGILSEYLSPNILQFFTFALISIVGSISMYYLILELFEQKNEIAFISGIFYFFNPYTMTQVWGRGLYAQFFSFALTPLFLLLFIKFIKSNDLKYLLLANIASIILSSTFTLITQVVVVWFPVLTYFSFILITNKQRFKKISYFIIFVLCWLLVNSWWLYPNLVSATTVYAGALSGHNDNLASLLGVSPHFTFNYIVRLMQNFYFFVANTYGSIYSTSIFWLFSWIIPVVALFSIPKFKKNKNLFFFGLLFFISFSVSLGANRPFGKLFIWFFDHFTFLQGFRNPYEKFGIVLVLAYAPLFSFGLDYISKRTRNFVKPLILSICCGIFVWPLWTGEFSSKNAWTSVPPYYQEAKNWLDKKGNNFRIMQFPLISGEGVLYKWGHPYQGVEPSLYLFSQNSIGKISNKLFYNVLLQRFGNFSPNAFFPDPDISHSEFRSDSLLQELSNLGVKYIVFHNDLDDSSIGGKLTKDDFIRILNNESGIVYETSFGSLDIYKINIPENISLVYSPNSEVSYKQISPTFYTGHAGATGDKTTDINFLDSYNANWQLKLLTNESSVKHSTVFSYANKWTVNKSDGFDFEIYYKPQESLQTGVKYALYSSLVIGLIYVIIKRRDEKKN